MLRCCLSSLRPARNMNVPTFRFTSSELAQSCEALASEARGNKGRRPPFDWAGPWFINRKPVVQSVLLLQGELIAAPNKEPGFSAPHFCETRGKLEKHSKVEPRPCSSPLPFVISIMAGSQGMNESEAKRFTSYTLRKFMPRCGVAARAPATVSRELEPGLRSRLLRAHESAKHPIADRYAFDECPLQLTPNVAWQGMSAAKATYSEELTWENLSTSCRDKPATGGK